MSDELIGIVSRWTSTGHITNEEKLILKAQYLLEIGAEPGCTTCESFYSDVKHHFAWQLKTLNLLPTVAKSIRKFLILGTSYLQLPTGQIFVNEGVDSEDRTVLTDEIAEQILADYPSYSTLIGINPEWQAANSEEFNADEPDGDESPKTVSLDKFEKLQGEYDALKREHTTLKGQHTKTINELTALKSKTTVDPVIPVPASRPSTPAAPPTEPADTGTGATGAAGTPAESSSGSTSESSSAGNSGADSIKSTVDNAKS